MALTSCPECKSEVSEFAKVCPHCGFGLKKYLRRKVNKRNRTIVFISVIAIAFLCSIVAIGFIIKSLINEKNSNQDFNGVLFSYSSKNKVDPYGLSNENNILGKNINDILCDYVEGVDYSVESNEYFCSYIFHKEIEYVIGRDVNLVIYTANNSTIINMFEYAFRFEDSDDRIDFKLYKMLRDIIPVITHQYDIEPHYTYTSESEIISITVEEFKTGGKQGLYNAVWEEENIKVGLFFTKLYDEKLESGSVSFSLVQD